MFDFERRGEVTEKGAARIGAMAYTMVRESVRRTREDFAKAGFPLTGLTMESFAHQNLFRRRIMPLNTGATAVLHVGRNWSRLEIGYAGNLMFVRVIKTSMSGMEQAILEALEARQGGTATTLAQPEPPGPVETVGAGEIVMDLDAPSLDGTGFVLELDAPEEPAEHAAAPDAALSSSVNLEHARQLLQCLIFGCDTLDDANPGKGLREADIMDMLEPAASRLVRQVEMTLKHFRESLGFEDVTRLMVSGIMGASSRFVGYIGEQLGMTCVALDPLGDYLAKGGNVPDLAAPCVLYAQALGLALSNPALTPNALHTYREKAEARSARALEQGTLVALAVVLLGLGYFSFDARMSQLRLSSEREGLIRERDSLGGKPDLAALSRQVTAFQSRRDAARAFATRARIPALWGAVLALAPEDVALGTLSADVPLPRDETSDAPKPQQGKPAPVKPGSLELSGVVTGDPLLFDSKLASFVMALEHSPLFGGATVKKGEQEILDGGITGLRFAISLVLAEKSQ